MPIYELNLAGYRNMGILQVKFTGLKLPHAVNCHTNSNSNDFVIIITNLLDGNFFTIDCDSHSVVATVLTISSVWHMASEYLVRVAGWLTHPNIDWGTPQRHWIVAELQCIVGLSNMWRFSSYLYTLRLRQNGRHFADDIFKRIFLNENVWISPKISLSLFLRFEFTKFQHWHLNQWLLVSWHMYASLGLNELIKGHGQSFAQGYKCLPLGLYKGTVK